PLLFCLTRAALSITVLWFKTVNTSVRGATSRDGCARAASRGRGSPPAPFTDRAPPLQAGRDWRLRPRGPCFPVRDEPDGFTAPQGQRGPPAPILPHTETATHGADSLALRPSVPPHAARTADPARDAAAAAPGPAAAGGTRGPHAAVLHQ